MPARQQSAPIFGVDLASVRQLPLGDLGIRFAFGAAISVIAGVVSVVEGSQSGGILLAFPAILPATLTLVEKEDSERQAEDFDVGSVLGAAALVPFAVVVWQFMPLGWGPVVLTGATMAWLATAIALYLSLRLMLRRRGPLEKGLAEIGVTHDKSA